ncbi:hypothetical protein BH10BAC5_BH10BAC5_13180 [soil metagenome]
MTILLRNIFLLFTAVLFCSIIGCSSTQNPCPCNAPLLIEKGKYNFVMYDSTGVNKIAEGDFYVESADTTKFKGTYNFKIVFQEDFPGQSSMNGDYTGQINYKERKASVNTNPRIADSNVFFSLYLDQAAMFGDWSYSTFRGPRAAGKVTISKPVTK